MANLNTNKNKTGSKNNVRLTKSQAENVVTIRVLLLVLFDILVCFLFDFVSRSTTLVGNTGFNLDYYFQKNVRPVLLWVMLALFLASVAYLVVTKVKKINTDRHPVTPAMLTAMTFILTVAVVFFERLRLVNGDILFYTMTVIISVLLALYYIYTMIFY